ncbi:hypothetical protein JVU11DRAFT_8370 [Chiua virens]|nr:hypothetical protein JVU11DRAFT_8370 [Chiua virens]
MHRLTSFLPSTMASNNYATTGSLNYFRPHTDVTRLFHHINADTKTGQHPRNWVEDPRVVDIENVRGSEDQYKLDNAGFQFGKASSKHTSFRDDDAIEAEYYPECTELIKKLTGASNVVIFDHTIRRRRPGQADDSPQTRQPVTLVHVDQTTASSYRPRPPPPPPFRRTCVAETPFPNYQPVAPHLECGARLATCTLRLSERGREEGLDAHGAHLPRSRGRDVWRQVQRGAQVEIYEGSGTGRIRLDQVF